MPCLDVQIPAADGASNGTLHVPEGDGPWPGVLVFPDAGGARETFRRMGAHLAGMGYAALITGAGVDHTIEFYPARHGFAVPDNPTYDAAASGRHWAALGDLYRARL
jgi:dienelactone hydrolase